MNRETNNAQPDSNKDDELIVAPTEKKVTLFIIVMITLVSLILLSLFALSFFIETKSTVPSKSKAEKEIKSITGKSKDELKILSKLENERLIGENLWKQLIAYEKLNQKNLTVLIEKFKEVKTELRDPIYIELVNKKIDQFKKENIELERQIAEKKTAKLLAREQLEKENKLKQKEERLRIRDDQFLNAIAIDLIAMDFKGALNKVRKADFDVARYEKVIKPLLLMEKLILLSFEKEINKKIDVNIGEESHLYEIIGIKDRVIYCKEKVADTYQKRSFTVHDLSIDDRLIRLGRVNATSKTIYAGLSFVSYDNFEKAIEYFKESGELATPLLNQIVEKKGYVDFEKIIKMSNLIDMQPIDEPKAEAILKAIRKYETKYEDSKIFLKKQSVIESIKDSMNKYLETQKGTSIPEPKFEGKK